MFAVIYVFEVKAGKEAQFQENWKLLTRRIYEYEGSLGSRLHKGSGHTYVAYANWPSKERWENSGSNLPEEARVYSKKMKEACVSIRTEHSLEVLDDLLQNRPYN